MPNPLCFVLMPFGKKSDHTGRLIDFNIIYTLIIRPAIVEAELEPIRADEEVVGGIIHKPMFERLIMCEYAVADLSLGNPNVFYELGVRHATRPWRTVAVFTEGMILPFDIAMVRALPYPLSSDGVPAAPDKSKQDLADLLRLARSDDRVDSPVFQLVDDLSAAEIDHTKTDVFRDRAHYCENAKIKLQGARQDGVDAVRQVERDFGKIENQEVGVVIDLFLSYRAVKAWKDMIALVEKMNRPLQRQVMIQEQLALALNRAAGELAPDDPEKAKLRTQAERVLTDLIKKRGPNSETNGILGRIYKDQWEEAKNAGDATLATGFLKKAIDAYLKGFQADWRDAYPGVNAVALMELRDPPDERRLQIAPVVAYAVERKIEAGEADYWDYATRLELAVLAKDREGATTALTDALVQVREVWEPETTARNLRLIRQAREQRGETVSWALEIENALNRAAGQ